MPRYVVFDQLDERVLRFRPGVKWGSPGPNVLPASIADMDYPVAEPVIASLRRYIDLGDFGYPNWPDGASPLRVAFAYRMKERYGWWAEPDHVREFTDVTHAMRVMLELCTEPGDGVAIHTPAFGPFVQMIGQLGRRLVPMPLIDGRHGWIFDPEDCARRVAKAGAKTLILVNPHNPTGRVFTRDELRSVAEAAERHGLIVISDELHADITYAPNHHVPFASLDPAVGDRTITMYSASKAFSLAGMRCAVGHVGVRSVREKLAAGVTGTPSVNVLGMRATLAAWTEGDGWLETVLDYLDGNRRLIAETVATRMPGVRHHTPQATYLAWLDCRDLGIPDPRKFFRERGRVELNPGHDYNPGGDGYVRINFATATPILREILDRLVESVTTVRAA
jgi:cysteine-S-conjugate beta-lyase